MNIKKESGKVNIGKVKRVNWLGKTTGLMFSRREKANALLFEFKKPTKMKIHSHFVFFPFLAIWLDEENNVLDLKEVKPFKTSIGIKESFSKLVEIPINRKNKDLVEISRR